MTSAPRRGSRTVLVWALGLWLVAGASVAGGIWIALRKPEPSLTGQNYYVLQWTQMSNCSVVSSLPDWGQFRLLWQTNDRDLALHKLASFEQSFRCL